MKKMESIEKISIINKESLNGERYLESLLEQAYAFDMLSKQEIERIQFDCITLLAKRTERYNGGDSSSIRVEVAQSLLTSIMFTVGLQLKTYSCPDDAVTVLQCESIKILYQKGRKRIDTIMTRAKSLHSIILSKLVESENIFYRSTVEDGIKGFFKLYDPEFGAQEIHITADYPIYNQMEKLAGIEFIQRYLEHIYYENMFCANFSTEDIHHLLCGYDKNYQNLVFNIYEPVLSAVLGCTIVGIDAWRLEITPSIIEHLYSLLTGKEKTEIESIFTVAFDQICHSFTLSTSSQEYIKQSLPQLAVTTESAVKMKTLERIFIVPRYPENDPKLVVSYGEKMDDELYRKVLEEFMKSQSIGSKIDIIKERIHSLADLEDLLLDAELYPDEISTILKELSPDEIAALMKKYIGQYEMCFTELRDCEKILCEGLLNFVASLSAKQKVCLEKAVKILEIN